MPKKTHKIDPETNLPTIAVTRPANWDRATSAAYLRLLGSSQQEAADQIGVDRVTVTRWEASDWWPSAVAEAKNRWLSGLAAKARTSVELAVPDDARLAMTVLERLEPALNPKATMEVVGDPTRPVRVEVVRRIVE